MGTRVDPVQTLDAATELLPITIGAAKLFCGTIAPAQNKMLTMKGNAVREKQIVKKAASFDKTSVAIF
jgi:hypothetical protein